MKIIYLIFAFVILPLSLLAQDEEQNLSSNISLGYDNTLLNHPLQFSSGFNLRYGKGLLKRKNNEIIAVSSFGYISTPKIDKRLLLGIGIEYRLDFLKRLEFSAGLQGNYILNILKYDVYEYDKNGQFSNKGNLIHQFRPSVYSNLGFNFIKKQTYNIGTFFEIRFIKLNESYTANFFRGFVPTISIGVKTKF